MDNSLDNSHGPRTLSRGSWALDLRSGLLGLVDGSGTNKFEGWVRRMFAVVAPRNIQPLILLEFFNDFCSSEQDHLLDRDATEAPEDYEGERNYGGSNNTT